MRANISPGCLFSEKLPQVKASIFLFFCRLISFPPFAALSRKSGFETLYNQSNEKKDPSCCGFHDFMMVLDIFGHEKETNLLTR